MFTDRPLHYAIAQLVNSLSSRPIEFVVEFFEEKDPIVVEAWLNGVRHPSDEVMTNILSFAEHAKTSELADRQGIPAALDHFWSVIEQCENNPHFKELDLRKGETVHERLLRFTNHNWMEALVSHLRRVKPRDRSKCFAEMRPIFKEHEKIT